MTLIKLSGRGLRALSLGSGSPFIGRISEHFDSGLAGARDILLLREVQPLPPGFRAYLSHSLDISVDGARDVYWLGPEFRYLVHGDVVRIDPTRRQLAVLYRRQSSANAFLVTERCDNYCLMCSQPPREQDDDWLVDELLDALPLISPDTEQIGITGGEPTLLGQRLIDVVDGFSRYLPATSIHLLSNGRRFSDPAFARALGDLGHPDLTVGVPIYSDLPEIHDFVVQAQGAFDETVRGIMNLKQSRVRVELRFVIHRETYQRLPQFAEFIARNLVFADHVALMGLELMGFARTNLETLWIDPLDYQRELSSAVRTLARAHVPVSIYNHQLCVLAAELHPFARKSISDWKNMYLEGCRACAHQDKCGGFFASSTLRVSRGIAAKSIGSSGEGAAVQVERSDL
jgi:His-Xaa-Ser system radical SAM maturase HxsC